MTRVLCLYFSQPVADMESVAEVFYRATPTIAWRSPFALFLEISKCQALYKESTFLARTRATLRRINLEANLAVADDLGTALGLALFRVNDKAKLPIDAISFYVDPLGHSTDNSTAEMARTLRLMGVKTIGDFLNVPARELASRFSRLGLLAHLRAQGQMPLVWPSFSPREQVIERFSFDEESPAENLQAVYFPLRPMIERVILRLRARGARIRQMDVVLRQEHGQSAVEKPQMPGACPQERRLALHIQLPYVGGNAIFQILREKLEAHVRQTPLTARISDVRLEVVEAAPYSPTQKNIFDQKKEETEEALFQLVNRLATRLGPDSVFFADPHANYLPEKNWRKTQGSPAERDFSAPANAGDNSTDVNAAWARVPERPLRLLPKPVPLEWTTEQWDVIHKEILLTDWWQPRFDPLPLERVYFRLASKNSHVPDLWVCKSSNGYFLHGVFE